jgi:transposase, IS5 family
VICADQIYLPRSNRAFCLLYGIRFSGPRLGRPKSVPELLTKGKRQFLDYPRQRNAVEGKICKGKRRSGFGLIRDKLPVTQGSTNALNVPVMHNEKLLEPPLSFLQPCYVFCWSWVQSELSHCASEATDSYSMMIGLQDHAVVLI